MTWGSSFNSKNLSFKRLFLSTPMAGEPSWISHYDNATLRETEEFDSISELGEEGDEEATAISVDVNLPDDLLELILACLPIASIFRAGCVCKRWHRIVTSKSFLWNISYVPPQKPWYFMFTSSDEPIGYAYDPVLRKWYSIELPFIGTSNWFIASSCGMVCFMDNDSRSELCVCNPVTRTWRKLMEPPGLKISDYSALAISFYRESQSYTVAIVKSKQVPGNFFQWDISIHIYDSEKVTWGTSITEVLMGWRGGDESVICNGVLYFLVYSTGGGLPENRHALVAYNVSNRSSQARLARSFIQVPCSLTCGRLMNMKEKLVMVGGLGKADRPDIIKGIGIWILNGKKWEEIAKMPHKFFQGFGELDDVFASRGAGDLIYIQSYGAPALLIFDMNHKHWKWSQKCPVTKKFQLQLFTGFCFEPRLEIAL
ncbi:PREDICTED: F-box/kelch-repeat protein At3g61590-like [Lupinus angustifolius]|nr:PREDICTED: F-box/kelch-repeat protein At3g61590-like [Lupinus angustifolius]